MNHRLRYPLLLGTAALLVSAPVLKAEKPEVTTSPVPVRKSLPKAPEPRKPAPKKAECKAAETQDVAVCSLKDGKGKTESVQKEVGKGSEQGQAMRKEHSKKWWKFWSKETPAE